MKNKKIILSLMSIVIIAVSIYLYNYLNYNEYYDENLYNLVIESTENVISEELKTEYIKVHVAGEVNNPGIVEIEKGARIYDAILGAGGITKNADENSINYAYILEDGQKVFIASKEKDIGDDIGADENGVVNDSEKTSKKININKANSAELQNIPRNR